MRSRDIFRRIVDSYLRDGEPVGSRNLSRMLPSSLSPATVRNVMSDLEHLGLVYAPHISAGRLPTQKGLRFFVDAFMELGDLSDEERRVIEAQVKASGNGATLEQMLTEASQMLSGMSRGAGLVLAANNEVALKHIEFIQLEPTKALAVLVVAERRRREPRRRPAGRHHRLAAARGLELPQRPYSRPHAGRGEGRDRPHQGRDQGRARHAVAGSGREGPGGLGRQPKAACRRGSSCAAAPICSKTSPPRPTSNCCKHLFEDLETQDGLIQLLDLAEEGSGVRIFIGSENKLFSLSGSSLVVAPYRDKDARVIGALGVIGPTRLNYARIVPMVDYTAQLVSRMLR